MTETQTNETQIDVQLEEAPKLSSNKEIIAYLEKLPVGKRVSVRSISNYLGVSDGTAYRAIKESENRG